MFLKYFKNKKKLIMENEELKNQINEKVEELVQLKLNLLEQEKATEEKIKEKDKVIEEKVEVIQEKDEAIAKIVENTEAIIEDRVIEDLSKRGHETVEIKGEDKKDLLSREELRELYRTNKAKFIQTHFN